MTFLNTNRIFIAIGIAMFMAACSNDDTRRTAHTLTSDIERNIDTNATPEEIKALASDNNGFASNLFRELYKGETGNLFYSPYSISHAMVMACAGSAGDTKNEIAKTFGWEGYEDDALHDTFNALDRQVVLSDDDAVFETADALWPAQDIEIEQSYVDTLRYHYGAPVQTLDYANAPEPSREIINGWVEEKTHGTIRDLIPEGSFDANTALVISNAVYFAGQWGTEFNASLTQDDLFTLKDGTQVSVPFMYTEVQARYQDSGDYEVVDLLFIGNKFMRIIFPAEGKFDTVLGNVDAVLTLLQEKTSTDSDSVVQEVHLHMPKFTIQTPLYDLRPSLATLGMRLAFDRDLADFSRMSDVYRLFMEELFHKAYISVDEKGCEASAATAIVIEADEGYTPPETIELTLDRPFIFTIQNAQNGQVLFMGTVMNPEN